MIHVHFRTALRTLRRRMGYTLVNVLGLTIGLACCALVTVFLQHELNWDSHHDGAERTYRILSDYGTNTYSDIRFEGFRSNEDDAAEQRSLVRELVESVPAVEQATNYDIAARSQYVETEEGERFVSEKQLSTTTGPQFVDVFSFERQAGAPLEQALREPGTAMLTESSAQTYFQDEDPIGKTLTINGDVTTVRAVVADPPSNSRVQFDVALHVKRIDDWAAFHYVRLRKGADPSEVTSQISAVMDEVDPGRVTDDDLKGDRLQALGDVYLSKAALFDRGPHRDVRYLWAFAGIGVLVLLITAINYTNLALALYADRHAEIGVRKAIGARQEQIGGQFLAESCILAILCVPLALLLCSAALPSFNTLMDTNISTFWPFQPLVVLAMVAVSLLTGGVAGSYPAIVLAGKSAVDLFSRNEGAGSKGRGWSLRHGLIALQFAVLIGLGSLSWIAFDQLRYMQGDNLGYQTANVVQIAGTGGDSARYQEIRGRLLESSAVEEVGMGPRPKTRRGRFPFALSGKQERVFDEGWVRTVDVHWFDVVGVEHPVVEQMKKEGPLAPPRVLLNQTAMQRVAPRNPVGERWITNPATGGFETAPIAGEISNMYIHSMREEISPTAYQIFSRPPWASSIMIRSAPGRMADALKHVEAVWEERRPNDPFKVSFLSSVVEELYEQERRFTALSGALTGLAILLAMIGLASLVAYLTRLRIKEIGVRKALGSSTASIVALLNREYVQIVGVAFLVGAPVAWLAADWWLSQFASRVGVSPLTFVGSGAIALLVAIMAVSVQSLRAARVDPAKVLRSE